MNPDRIALLEKFIEEDPAEPFNYYALALEYHNDNPQKTEELFDQLLIEFPDYLPVYYAAGMFQAGKNNAERAMDILNRGYLLAKEVGDLKTQQEIKSAMDVLEF
jgi:hypothetical protein